MALRLHTADMFDPLLESLARVLCEPGPDPFQPELVVIPTVGMEDALKAGLGAWLGATGAGDGVVANIEFLFPGAFMARVLHGGEPGGAAAREPDAWELEQLAWHVLAELHAGGVGVPGANLSNRWQVARHLADLFDRYGAQRPELLQAWAQGERTDGTAGGVLEAAHQWQYDLWRRLRARIGTPSPAERLPGLLEEVRAGRVAQRVPSRVCAFGFSSLAPGMLRVLHALGERHAVHVFVRHPSRHAWAGCQAAAGPAPTPRDGCETAGHVLHPLLASWGRPALETRALVAGLGIQSVTLDADIAEPQSWLGRLQRDIRLDREPARLDPAPAWDSSLQVHACHGDLRQVEVLRDALGHAFEDNPALQPHDVLVLCPDLERFAPLVEAVFAQGGLPLPVRVGDRALASTDPVAASLLGVLEAAHGRAPQAEVVALLGMEPVRQRFGWSLEDLERIAGWCERLGVRWGVQPGDREEGGLPATVPQGTWRDALDRLLVGAAMPAPTARLAVGGVLPHDSMGADELALAGRLAEFLQRLSDLRAGLRADKPIDAWVNLLQQALDDFCELGREEAWRLQRVAQQLERLRRAGQGCPVALAWPEARSALEHALADLPGRVALRSGRVTVTSLVPMQGVPARVICLLGLDQGSLRSTGPDGDDVLAVRPCVGERHLVREGRQALLDVLLSARDRLLITCNGTHLVTNRGIPLAAPLEELLDAVDMTCPLPEDRAPVVVRHPRHGFDERALRPGVLVPGATRSFTFDTAMLAAAEARRNAAAGAEARPGAGWELPPRAFPPEVALVELEETVKNPARVYWRERLGCATPEGPEVASDAWPLTIGSLLEHELARELLQAASGGASADAWMDAVQREGRVPPGQIALARLAAIKEAVEGLLARLQDLGWAGVPRQTREVRVPGVAWSDGTLAGEVTVHGLVGDVCVNGAEATVIDADYGSERPWRRLAVALRLAALTLAYPELAWSGLIASVDTKGIRIERVRLRGDLRAREAHARSLLSVVLGMRAWALRDAVPWMDRASHELAMGGGDRGQSLGWDMLDGCTRRLWGDVAPDVLLSQPVLPTDPPRLVAGMGGDPPEERMLAVARAIWGTYSSAVEQVAPERIDPAGGGAA